MTVRDVYDQAVEILADSGYESSEARAAARVILRVLTGQQHAHLVQPERELPDKDIEACDEMLRKLRAGEPLSYVVGEREFYGLSFEVKTGALIPRPETEILVETAVKRLWHLPSAIVADLGTGSGCIAVSVAHALENSFVLATDANPNALEIARANACAHGVAERVEFLRGEENNWAAPLLRENFKAKFDAILSNPPYIATEEIETLQPQVKNFEPRSALDGGADGLDCYRQIAAQCAALLAPGGFLAVELGAGQFDDVKRIFEYSHWRVEEPIRDLAGIERVLVAQITAQ
jgi:release factor glutamine methyltransferase